MSPAAGGPPLSGPLPVCLGEGSWGPSREGFLMANTLAQRTLPAPKQPVGDGAGPGAGPGAVGLRGRGLIPAPSDVSGPAGGRGPSERGCATMLVAVLCHVIEPFFSPLI